MPIWVYMDDVCMRCYQTEYRLPDPRYAPRRHCSMSQDVELWKRELIAAGWRPMRPVYWRAPCGCLHLGPYGAWVRMLAMKANGLSCPTGKSHAPCADFE